MSVSDADVKWLFARAKQEAWPDRLLVDSILDIASKNTNLVQVAGRQKYRNHYHYFDESDPFPLNGCELLYRIEVHNDAV